MNFVFISPNFPDNYYLFCRGLKNNGVNVLGIGDTPYNALSDNVKANLTEYYYVHSLENYDEKLRAVAFFTFKYGKIDFIESNNEYWLASDAQLRTDFNVTTGPKADDIRYFRSKTAMKEDYAKANVKTARYHIPSTIDKAKEFIKEVGYPVIVKPDDGVGAIKTYKITNDQELITFFQSFNPKQPYIMEEFVEGDLISFDGICDSHGNVVIPTHHVFPNQIMDVVNNLTDVFYYTNKEIPQDLYEAGQRVLLAFKAKSRFYHLEFFRLTKDKIGLGKKGDLIGLEVNMRVPGGYTPDMIDYAYQMDIYQAWADVICYDHNNQYIPLKKKYCAFYGRRRFNKYKHKDKDVLKKYLRNLMMFQEMPRALSDAMGDYFYICTFDTLEEMTAFRAYLSERE